jgi:hypothetical protein
MDVRLDQIDARLQGGAQAGDGVSGAMRHGEQPTISHARTISIDDSANIARYRHHCGAHVTAGRRDAPPRPFGGVPEALQGASEADHQPISPDDGPDRPNGYRLPTEPEEAVFDALPAVLEALVVARRR